MRILHLLATLFSVVFFSTEAVAQISDSLYKALPAAVRPFNKISLTSDEKRRILLALDDFDAEHYRTDLQPIAAYLEAEATGAKQPDVKIYDLNALTNYYFYFAGDSIVVSNKRLLFYINGNSKYNNMASAAYLNLGEYYMYGSQYDSAINTLHAALNIAITEKDSTVASRAYSIYSALYSTLHLYDSSVYYEKQALRFFSAKNEWNVEYTQNILGLVIDYDDLYKQEKQYWYLDSAYRLIYAVMEHKKGEPQYWYGACYFLLGHCNYLAKNYKQAVVMFDSSILPAYNHSSKYYGNYDVDRYLYKAECLIKMGEYARGKLILDNVKLPDGQHITAHQLLYQALNEYAEGTGDDKNALLYYKKYRLYTDTFDLEGQKGRLFEAEHKYSVKQKEADIAVLENKNLQVLAVRNKIVATAVIVVLLLGMALYVRSTQQRHQRELALANQRKTISADMHDEVNSGLAALRFLIADLRERASNEETKTLLADLEQEANGVYIHSRNFMHHIGGFDEGENQHITALLNKLALRFDHNSSLQINIDADETEIEKHFTQQQHIEMGRIIKEAVANTMKYSGASKMYITIKKQRGRFWFEIKDNGKWAGGENTQTGIGLTTIYSRINALKGHLNMAGGEDGTTITGSFPLKMRWWL